MIGKTIGRYRILDLIGQGGMGEVFLARDTVLDRNVALKLLPVATHDSPQARMRFLREARSAAAIDHPYVCKIYDAGEDNGRVFIGMEFVEGQTLEALIKEDDTSVRARLRIILEIAEAVVSAHDRGIVHRDLKPANIMLTPGGHVKVMDFGLAKHFSDNQDDSGVTRTTDLTQEGRVVGTPAYMSPEQAQAYPLDARSDIFSFGVIAYELLCGVHPFRKPMAIQTLTAIVSQPHAEPTTVWPDCPPAIVVSLARMLSKTANQRTASMREVHRELNAVFEGDPSASAPALAALHRVPSVAVLPFANMSTDPENEFFSDGVTEEIITQLSKLRDLKVISRTSVMRFKNSDRGIREIGAELGVDTIVEGSVRRMGDTVRIASKVIDVATETQVWADAVSREMKDVFELQVEISKQIADALEQAVNTSVIGAMLAREPHDVEAYQDYLKGRHSLHKSTHVDIQEAVQHFERALHRDPSYAPAWAGLAHCFVQSGYLNFQPIHETFPRAKAAAEKALELAPSLAEAHNSMALVHLFHDWDWEATEREFRHALELNPSLVEARTMYSWYLAAIGRIGEALEEARNAVSLDPLSPFTGLNLGWVLFYGHQFDEAEIQLERTLELNPGFVPARITLACVYLMQERHDEAIPIFEAGVWTRAQLAQAYAYAGRHDEARALLETLMKDDTPQSISSFDIALTHFFLDDVESALPHLEAAHAEHDAKIIYLRNYPSMQRHHSHPELSEFFRRAGLK